MPEDQLALDDIRGTLLDIAQSGLVSRPTGVHLPYIGVEFAKRKNAPFEQYLNVLAVQHQLDVPISARKLVPFIERYCSDLFMLTKSPGGPQVVTLANRSDDPADYPTRIFSQHKYKKAVWAAFIRPLPEDYKRYLNVDTLGFTDAKRKPAGDIWIEIPRDLITETPMNQPIDGPLVQANIGSWISQHEIDTNVLLDQSASGAFDRATDRASVEDLLRIINALPRDICIRWLIPAEVFRALGPND